MANTKRTPFWSGVVLGFYQANAVGGLVAGTALLVLRQPLGLIMLIASVVGWVVWWADYGLALRSRPEDWRLPDYSTPAVNLSDPKGCHHDWTPVSMVFETQILDREGRVLVRQPDVEKGRVYLVCLRCAQYTYMTTNWVGFFLGGSTTRGFAYKPNSSHAYSIDGGTTWRPEKPTDAEIKAAGSQ